MLETDQKSPAEKLIEAILAAAPDKRAIVMTAAQQRRQEGIQLGIVKGMKEGRQEGIQARSLAIARNMLFNLHLGMDVVQKATGLAREARKQLQAG